MEEILDSIPCLLIKINGSVEQFHRGRVFSFCIEFLCVGADLDVDFAELLLIFSMVDKVTVTLSSTFHSLKRLRDDSCEPCSGCFVLSAVTVFCHHGI